MSPTRQASLIVQIHTNQYIYIREHRYTIIPVNCARFVVATTLSSRFAFRRVPYARISPHAQHYWVLSITHTHTLPYRNVRLQWLHELVLHSTNMCSRLFPNELHTVLRSGIRWICETALGLLGCVNQYTSASRTVECWYIHIYRPGYITGPIIDL